MQYQQALLPIGSLLPRHQGEGQILNLDPACALLIPRRPANAQPREHHLSAAQIGAGGQQHFEEQRIAMGARQPVLTIKPVVDNPAGPVLDAV